uniref:Reverse transcriptase n=1 Tax=Peronospora matthiolae TaxID=2874970 RepID=A0AAV1VDY7_9STRA
MAELAVNNSMHASTTHVPFFVNGLRHPRLPAFWECDTVYGGEGARSNKTRSGSCSSHVDNGVDVMDANVDHIDTDDDDDDDAGISGIANDCHSKDDDALTGRHNVLKRFTRSEMLLTRENQQRNYLLTCEAVVRFVQEFISDA